MTKKKTGVTPKRVKRATQAQKDYIDKLGTEIYGPEVWPAKQIELYQHQMTYVRASDLIKMFQRVLGTR